MTTYVRPPMPTGVKTLPARYYTDPAHFALELERIHFDMWLCAGRADALAAPGRYFLRQVGNASVIVLRGEDGQVRAFHNVCRHRGTLLCSQPEGALPGRIQCSYHAWTYRLDGTLLAAPHMDQVEGFREADYPLRPVEVALWDGHVFINLSERPAPLADQLAALPEKFRPWGMADLRMVERRVYPLKTNWKLIFQNYSECLHCPLVHPLLQKQSHYLSGDNEPPQPTWLGGRMDLRDGVQTLSMDGTTNRACLPGLSADDRRRVRVALPSRGHGPPRLRPERRDRLLGPHEPPGLGAVGACPEGHRLAGLPAGALLEPRGAAARPRPVRARAGGRSLDSSQELQAQLQQVGRPEDDLPQSHLAPALLAVHEADRHLVDAAAGGVRGPVEHLHQERIARGVQPVPGHALQHLAPVGAEARGAVAGGQAEQHAHEGVGGRAEQAPGEGPVADAPALDVAGADGHVAALERRQQARDVVGVVREVAVAGQDGGGPRREGAAEAVGEGLPVARLAGPMDHLQRAVLPGELVRHLGRAVAGGVVHHQDPQGPVAGADARHQPAQVLCLVERGQHEPGAHFSPGARERGAASAASPGPRARRRPWPTPRRGSSAGTCSSRSR